LIEAFCRWGKCQWLEEECPQQPGAIEGMAEWLRIK